MSGELHPPGTPPGVPPLPPLLTPVQAAVLLDQVIYEQVLECVDLDALYHVAQSLDTMIGEIDGIADDRVSELARSMLDRALLRLPDDLRAYLRISEWASRDACVLCESEARQAKRAAAGGAVTATGGHRRSTRPNS
jgi:hypothetical protein